MRNSRHVYAYLYYVTLSNSHKALKSTYRAMLKRASSCPTKGSINKTVDYTLDGSYMKNVNRHATYKEINGYVEEKYGFKLHSAFIAQVKRECGIRKNGREL